MRDKNVLIMAGGTGGHVFPGLALASELKVRGAGVEWLGTSVGIEARLVPAADIPLHFIPVKGVRGKGIKQILLAPWNIFSSVVSAYKVIKKTKPDVVVGLGGFVAGPGGAAAKLLGVPLVIHEQNAVPGTTNKILSKIATYVLTAFPVGMNKSICIGNPVRSEIEAMEAPSSRLARDMGSINILVVGGSRGAQAMNELLPNAFLGLDDSISVNIWHQAGAGKDTLTKALYQQYGVNARVEAFIDDMVRAYSWADFVVCRSGALTVSELAAAGLGAVLIPFPYAIDDHQTANAKYLEGVGAAVIKQQDELTVESMRAVLAELIHNKEKIIEMAKAARTLAKPRAAQEFANYCEELACG